MCADAGRATFPERAAVKWCAMPAVRRPVPKDNAMLGLPMTTPSDETEPRIIVRPAMKDVILPFLLPTRVSVYFLICPLIMIASGSAEWMRAGLGMLLTVVTVFFIYFLLKMKIRLIIYPFGVEYSDGGTRIVARWKDIKKKESQHHLQNPRNELLLSKNAIVSYGRYYRLLHRNPDTPVILTCFFKKVNH